MNFARRVAKLKELMVPKRRARIAIRFEGPGSESLSQPTEEEIAENMTVTTVGFVETKDGRLVENSGT